MKMLPVAALVFLMSAGALHADAPGFHSGVALYDGAYRIDTGDGSAPIVIDWNNDGKKDLVVGSALSAGRVRLYLNQNTDDDPRFSGYSFIMSNGVPINVTYGGGG